MVKLPQEVYFDSCFYLSPFVNGDLSAKRLCTISRKRDLPNCDCDSEGGCGGDVTPLRKRLGSNPVWLVSF